MKNSVVLCILDGWGIGESNEYNAITESRLKCWNNIIANYPSCQLKTSGSDVGLPKGQIGNSEVGHSNIGSGRILLQDLYRINDQINTIENSVIFVDFIKTVSQKKGIIHIAGLLSDGGVHSHQNHIFYFIEILSKFKLSLAIHCFLDGRDTAPSSAIKYIMELKKLLDNKPNAFLATISGRYYAMDRDNRIDRTKKACDAMYYAIGEKFDDPISFINKQYELGVTDEFINPAVFKNYSGIDRNDGFLLANFRSDRVLQLLGMMKDNDKELGRKDLNSIIGMVNYSDTLNIPSLFPTENIHNTLGEVVANSGLKQLRIAETEKYAHVTFFFNGGKEEPFFNEERIIIKSPFVSTYDLIPEMSAYQLTDELIKNLQKKEYSLVVINYANADMVGHTGNLEATKQAVQTIDKCLEKLFKESKELNAILMITADHGNAEKMFDVENNTPYTAHTINNVPFVLCNYDEKIMLNDGRLCDIAPTILQILGLKKPVEMTGKSLIS